MTGRGLIYSAALTWIAGWFAFSPHAAALDPKTSDPREILRAAFDTQLAPRSISRLKMSIRDRSGSRERLLQVKSKREAEVRKTLILIEQPADVRNTGFLSVDYRDRARVDDRWLFIPKLHRATRVPSTGRTNAFAGSDFSIFDLSGQDPDNYSPTLGDAGAKVGEEPCWLISAAPRDDTIKRESGYEKTDFWISKTKLVVLQFKAVLVGGKRAKYFKASDLKQDNGTWTPHRLQMRTLEGTELVSETLVDVLTLDHVATDLADGEFTQQRLERGI